MVKRSAFVLLALALLLIAAVGGAAVAAPNAQSTNTESTDASSDHVTADLKPVNGSGVHGVVDLRQLSPNGTHIMVSAKGLKPGKKYVSLYYDNHQCDLEPYSQDDVIGGRYSANRKGIGHTSGDADDDLDEINSVSVRSAKNFTLLACADVHPS